MGIQEGVITVCEEKNGEITILKMTGRLDAGSTPNAEKMVFESIENGATKLLLDLAGVNYLSSAGMRMLLSTTKKLKTNSGKLIVCSPAPNVMEVLKMSGFDQMIEISKSQEDALRKF